MQRKRLRVGAFQFAGHDDPLLNAEALVRGISLASRAGVQLLATQECALCGYPPNDLPSTAQIDPGRLDLALSRVVAAASEHEVHVLLGTVLSRGPRIMNAVRLLAPCGESERPYTRRALHDWERDNFSLGDQSPGVYDVKGVRVGVRICYEVRFPEYFRELLRERVELAVVPFADCGGTPEKYRVIPSHLVSRAAKNAMYVLSSNSISGRQNAPTCLVDPDGRVVATARPGRESLIHAEIEISTPGPWSVWSHFALTAAATAGCDAGRGERERGVSPARCLEGRRHRRVQSRSGQWAASPDLTAPVSRAARRAPPRRAPRGRLPSPLASTLRVILVDGLELEVGGRAEQDAAEPAGRVDDVLHVGHGRLPL